jgi:hypothetical protein
LKCSTQQFDTNTYLAAKAQALNAADSNANWTPASVLKAITDAGMSVYDHYNLFGANEGVNPSNAFDASSYYDAKLAKLQADPATASAWADKTAADVKDAIAEAGMTPVEHFLRFGQDEGLAAIEVPADERPGEGGDGDTFTLTKGLENLAAAQDAETAFLEGLDALDTDLDGTDDVDAGDAVDTDVTTFYANASADMGTETAVTSFSTRSDAVQDAAIADKLASYEEAVTTATGKAADNMTALLAAADTQSENVVAAQEAKLASGTELTAEEAAFDSANGPGTAATVIFDEDYDSTANNTGKLIIVNGKAYTGEDGSTTAVALSSLTEDDTILRVSALETAHDADVAAGETLTAAKTALESAVEAVVLAETEAFSVYDLGSLVIYNDAAATVTLDYSAADIQVFDTKALADADAAGVKEVFKAAFTTEATSAAETIIFDGATINVGADDTAATIAANVASASFANWTAVDNKDGSVTFTAKVAGDVVDITDVVTTGTYDESVTITKITDGIDADAGTGTTTESVPNALALEGAISDLADFQELKAAFEEARTLDDQLTALKDAITAAEEAIENDVDDADAPGLGLNLETFEDGAVASADNDVYLFDADEASVTIGSFGVTGEDTIFFGTNYSLVELTDGDTITDAVGDVSALEIFWEVQGGNLILHVEEETFAGNGSTAADTVEITLTGVTADEFTFAGGFLSSGTAV